MVENLIGCLHIVDSVHTTNYNSSIRVYQSVDSGEECRCFHARMLRNRSHQRAATKHVWTVNITNESTVFQVPLITCSKKKPRSLNMGFELQMDSGTLNTMHREQTCTLPSSLYLSELYSGPRRREKKKKKRSRKRDSSG